MSVKRKTIYGTCSQVCFLVTAFVLGLVATGLCADIPTIDKLTNGKIKNGDLITKANVDTVKEWLAPGTYEQVKRGMVLVMAPPTPLEAILPSYFLEATKKNAGQAVLGKNDVPYTKDGKKWPGGFPFPNAKTGIEAMNNYRFALLYGADDFNYFVRLDYIDKTGKSYKYSIAWYRKIWMNGRLFKEPKPSFPEHENEIYRGMIMFTEPQDLRGISQIVTRYYDDTAKEDDGYVYVPALKRTRRISATNWQDNLGGSDMTWGDADGLVEPYSLWKFTLLERKFMIMPGMSNPPPTYKADGQYVSGVESDVGVKFRRLQWEVRPVFVVEGKPKGTHIYGKQILYLDELSWRSSEIDKYDRQGKLWKVWNIGGGPYKDKEGYKFAVTYYPWIFDLQVDHMTRLSTMKPEFNVGVQAKDYSTKKMLELGH